jgi:ABC-type sugar transport system permease subunit
LQLDPCDIRGLGFANWPNPPSRVNWTLVAVGLLDPATQLQFLGQQDLAMIAVTVVHAWRLFPFGVVIFIAGFNSVPKDVLDAATVDGAGFWRRNYQIILPIIAPIVMIALIFGTVFTFTDLSIVYLLTKGGPMNGTQVLGSLAFQVGIMSGDVAPRRRDLPVPVLIPADRRGCLFARPPPTGDLACGWLRGCSAKARSTRQSSRS